MNTYGSVLDALGDDTRRRVFERLQSGSLAVGELCEGLDVSRPAVSQHLRVLLDAGLVDVEQVGTRRYYRVQPRGLDELQEWLDGFWNRPIDQFVRAAEARSAKDTTMTPKTDALQVVRTIEVEAPIAVAWSTWIDGIGQWWPTRTHSVGGEDVRDVRIEPQVDGRVYEVLDDGTEHVWGHVRAIDPPHRLVQTWHPGTDPAVATELTLTFTALGSDRTRLELRHTGWERRPDGTRAARDYDSGWGLVLGDWASAVREG